MEWIRINITEITVYYKTITCGKRSYGIYIVDSAGSVIGNDPQGLIIAITIRAPRMLGNRKRGLSFISFLIVTVVFQVVKIWQIFKHDINTSAFLRMDY